MKTQLKNNNFLLYSFGFLKSLHFFGSLSIPFYLDRLEMSYTWMFVIETIFSVFLFLFEIPTGIVADKFGRKTSLVLGSGIFGFSFVILGITRNITVLLFVQILGALGMSLISGADKALIYENAKLQNKSPEEISAMASRFNGFETVAMLIAFPLGSLFVSCGFMDYVSALGFVFVATGIAMLVASVLIFFVKEPAKLMSESEKTEIDGTNEKKDKPTSTKKMLEQNAKGCFFAFKNPELRKLSLDYSVISAFTFLMFWFYQSLLLENNVNIAVNGFVASGFNLAASLLLFSSGFIQKKLGFSKTRFLSALIPGILYVLVFIFYRNIFVAMIAIFGITMLRLFRDPILITQMNVKINDENRATILSGVSMFSRIIIAIFYPLSGILMDKNPQVTYLVIGIATVVCSFLLSTPRKEK